jgi:RNA polymerase sigma-70 factor (ECF subfamily)
MVNNPEDAQLDKMLAKIGRGDLSAAPDLFARFQPRLHRMIRVRLDDRLSSRVDPSDVAQEVFLQASTQIVDYAQNPALPFYPWLRQLALHRLNALHRQHLYTDKRSVYRELSPQLSDSSTLQLAEQVAASDTGPLKHLIREELRRCVRQALAQLPESDREVLILRHLEGLNYADCAAVLQISEPAARQRHVRAVRRIHRLMVDYNPGDSG